VITATEEDFMFVVKNRWSLNLAFHRAKIAMSGEYDYIYNYV
jgi:hypothetical protein